MRVDTYELTNRVAKELSWNNNDILDIARAEKRKAKLENEGFNLKFEKVSFSTCTLGYIKYN